MNDGEGPVDDPEKAHQRAKAERDKPEHKRPVGHPDDRATEDGDIEAEE
ncbi:MAG: hypothetical protein ACO3RU_13605 [Planctomycetota bacterium]